MLIAEYEDWMARHQMRPKTIKSYKMKISLFVLWLESKGVEVPEVDPDHIWKFHEHLLIDREQKASTRTSYLNALRNYFEFLIDKGIFQKNPAKEVTRPKIHPSPPRSLNEEEITRLMTAAFANKTEKGMRDLAIMSILTGTGCRVSALTALRIMDFWTKDEMLPQTCQTCGQYLLSGRFAGRGKKVKVTMVHLQEKSGKEWNILLPEKATFYLSQYLNNRKVGMQTDIVFPVRRGGEIRTISRHGVLYMLKRYAKKAGIAKALGPHAFRHAAITWWLDYGVDPETVQRWVGHAALQQTLAYRNQSSRAYIHSGIATDRNLLERVQTPMDIVFKKVRQ